YDNLVARGAAKVVVPADQMVFGRVDLGQGGGVILAAVPQIDLHVVGRLIAGAAAHHRGCADLVDHHRHQLDHVLDRAGGAAADRHAARQHRVLDRCVEGGALPVDVADVAGALAQPAQDVAHGAGGVVGRQAQHIAGNAAGAAGQAVPQGAGDAAVDDAVKNIAGAGQDDVGHIGGGIAGAGGGAARQGHIPAGAADLLVDDVGGGAGQVAHIIQDAVGPQIAGDVVQDQAVDLARRIGGVVADVIAVQCHPR